MDEEAARRRILELARSEGFEHVRFASAEPMLEARAAALRARAEGRLDGLAWMTDDWLTRATDAGAFLACARSVILVDLPCHAAEPEPATGGQSRGRVARYARGHDYHRVFEKKLRRMAKILRAELGASARATVDYGPLLERPLAAASGMGWLGKSTMLLVPGVGPWVLLGAIATDLVVEPDLPLAKSCGSCTRCILACPTGALSPAGHLLDARLCISYHTIESRGPIPRELRPRFGDRVFGCDECLDSCPVGSKHFDSHPDFVPGSIDDARPVLSELIALDENAFGARFRGRAIMRAKRDGLARNACVALGNVGGAADVATLEAAFGDSSALVRGHAAWAVAHLILRLGLDPDRAVAALENAQASEHDGFALEEINLALATLRDPPGGPR
jgi:epoxyqueuosine reductase